MAKIKMNYDEAKKIASDASETCDKLSAIADLDIPELASTFGGEEYFSALKKRAKSLADKGTSNVEVANGYIEKLQALNGETVESMENPGEGSAQTSGAGGGVSGARSGSSGFAGRMDLNNYDGDKKVIDRAKKLKESNKMDEKSYKKTVGLMNTVAAMYGAGQLTLNSYKKTADTTDHAMSLLESGKMDNDTYYKTIDTIDGALSLVKAKKMSDSTYSKALDTIDRAMTALEKGKMSQNTYNKVIDSLNDAMQQVKNGKMTDTDFRRTLETIDNCTTQVQKGKMDEKVYGQTVDTISDASKALGTGKLSDSNYRQTLSAIDGAADLVGSGKLDQTTYGNMIGTIDGALADLNAGKMSADTYQSTVSGMNYALTKLNSEKISLADYKNAINAINSAYSDFKAGKIDEATYKKMLQQVINKLNGYEPSTSAVSTSPQSPTPGTGSVEVATPRVSVPDGPDSSKTVEGSSIGGSLAGGVVSSSGANSLTGATGSIGGAMSGSNKADPVMKVIEQGTSQLVSSVLPFSGSSTGSVSQNNASAGIIAAASLLAGGAAAGGGIFMGKKMSVVRFTPEDWNDLDFEYQKAITSLMEKVGFSDSDIETFTNSKFKISAHELKEHINKIEKAVAANPSCEEDLMNLYKFSIFDENSKVIDYLLFIVMVIDGFNAIDDYNMYNVINQSIDDIDSADFIYSGISMENYFDDNSEPEGDVMVVNDPLDSSEEELEEAVSPSMGKDWLKDIGVDSY